MDFEPSIASPLRDRLPTISPPLIGRDTEVATVETLLAQPDVRLVTLTGTGGIGKTRLALQVAENWSRHRRARVRFVALDTITEARLVMAAIARGVGGAPADDRLVEPALQATLHDTEWLVVLDSFEHVLEAAPAVADLLTAYPLLTVLVTSRSRLRLREERVIPVPPLALAEPTRGDETESAAVQLFVARAQMTDPAFAPDSAAMRTIAAICERLDGLPLAIELVAPRVRHLSVTELLERLDRRLPMLTGGARDHPARLQTMRHAIAWSYDLLDPTDQVLFQRLTVFSDGFTAASAERIAAGPSGSDSATSVLDSLASLVDASLLLAEPGPGGTTRYRLLETLREFALDQLIASDDEAQVRDRHAAWCLEFADEFALASLHPTGEAALARMEADHANLRAALTWLDGQNAHDHMLTLATNLARFWSEMGHYQEGHHWLGHALERAADDAPRRAQAEVALGLIEIYRGEPKIADTFLRMPLERTEVAIDPWTEGLAHIGLGGLATMAGEDERGVTHLTKVLACADQVADARLQNVLRGWAQCNLGMLARERGDLAAAGHHLPAALDHLKAAGYATGTIMVLGDLGDLARDQLDYSTALQWYGEGLRRGRSQTGTRVLADVIESVGLLAMAVGEVARGTRILGAGSAIRERLGLRYRVARNQQDLLRAGEIGLATLGAERQSEIRAEGRRLSTHQALLLASEPIAIPEPVRLAAALTQREREILRLLATGQSDAAIADTLYLSVRTVENHVAHIRAKLQVSSRTEAARIAGLAFTGHKPDEYSTRRN